jgi:hypothetical protein
VAEALVRVVALARVVRAAAVPVLARVVRDLARVVRVLVAHGRSTMADAPRPQWTVPHVQVQPRRCIHTYPQDTDKTQRPAPNPDRRKR